MTAKLIDGKQIAQQVRQNLRKETEELARIGIVPGLAVILAGDNQASKTYVANKQKACAEIGMHSVLIEYPESVTQETILAKIQELNRDDSIHGILVQLPLPEQIDETAIIESISPEKDADGFHPINAGRMMIGEEAYLPCTPHGIMVMLDHIGCEIEGKHAVIVGRSNIVGKPAGQLLLNRNATVTYCHSRTKDLASITRQADILVVAVGKRGMISGSYVKEGAVVIDVGMNRNDLGKLCGDVLFEEVKEKASYITPVPGGVGPMTITMLLKNTIQAARKTSATLNTQA